MLRELPADTDLEITYPPAYSSHLLLDVMDTGSYDLQAWQTYYESQGYDAATSASYAYYALQQAQAAAVSATASTSAAAYGVRPLYLVHPLLIFESLRG